MRKDIRYICISDIHLGNRRNKANEIISNLDVWFNHYKTRSDLDIVFIAGDIFDRLLDFSSDDVIDSTLWLGRLINWCIRSRIKLRILLGTYSHDMNQARIVNVLTSMVKEPLDISYITSLSIETIDDLDITVLYIPDEWNSEASKTYEEVLDQLSSKSLKAVDLCIMHGNFEYQLPILTQDTHNQAQYESIVNYYINIGHVHTYTTNGKVIAQGSFDRLTHGEEESKGGVECVIRTNGTKEHYFIENKNAKIFKTIKIIGNDVDKATDKIRKIVSNLKPFSYVRISAKKNHPIFNLIPDLSKEFNDITFSKLTDEEEVVKPSTLFKEITDESYVPIHITKDNITRLVEDRLTLMNTNLTTIETSMKLLNTVI